MKQEYKLTKELFVIPVEKEKYILYAPLKGVIYQVKPGVLSLLKAIEKNQRVGEKKILEDLIEAGIVVLGKEKIRIPENKFYLPTETTLLPTYNCNLRCKYCYSKGGENIGSNMEYSTAKKAIDFIIENAERLGKKEVVLGFHGGGEPLLASARNLVNSALDYFNQETEKRGFKHRTNVVTNGILKEKDLNWLVSSIDNINISLDGPEDIQNNQRPLASGKPSFPYVLNTVNFLESRKAKYAIRATITEDSVSRMEEIIRFFHSIAPSLKSFHLEPLFECGRCSTTQINSPEPADFILNLKKVMKFADKEKIEIYYSGGNLRRLGLYFCGATGKNFYVAPDGNITSCLEVCRKEDSRSEIFFIGKINNKNKKPIIYQDRLDFLRERKVTNIGACKNCFAKYNCSGDCLAKTLLAQKTLYQKKEGKRCEINRFKLLSEIKK
jgi:uncharacterized protein